MVTKKESKGRRKKKNLSLFLTSWRVCRGRKGYKKHQEQIPRRFTCLLLLKKENPLFLIDLLRSGKPSVCCFVLLAVVVLLPTFSFLMSSFLSERNSVLSFSSSFLLFSSHIPTEKWKNFEYLSKAVPSQECQKVHTHSSPLFGPIWRPEKPMSTIPSIHWTNPYTSLNLPSTEFFSRLAHQKNQQQQQYLSWNQDVTILDIAALYDISPIRDLIWNPQNSQLNLWAGRNVATHLHFDSFINLYIQIVGKKEFIICPPNQSSVLHPYPFLHPSYSHAQIDVSSTASSLSSLFDQAKGCSVALLRPGDVLFLPPYFWHHVTSLGTSISVNAWSVTDDSDLFEAAVSATETFFAQVDNKEGEDTKRAFSSFSSSSRSASSLPLLSVSTWALSSLVHTMCSSGATDFCAPDFLPSLLGERYIPSLVHQLAPSLPPPISCPSPEDLLIVEETIDQSLFEPIIQHLMSIREEERLFWFSNLVEMVILVGTQDDIFDAMSFICHCL